MEEPARAGHRSTRGNAFPSPLLLAAPAAAPAIDCSHVVSLVHSMARLSHYDAGAVDAAAALLLPNLDVLTIEELITSTWAFSTILMMTMSENSLADRDAMTNHSDIYPEGGNKAGPLALSGYSSPPAAAPALSHSEAAPRALLRALSGMLREAVPAGRRPEEALTAQELQLLWQAHACSCLLASSDNEGVGGEIGAMGLPPEGRMGRADAPSLVLDVRPDIVQAGGWGGRGALLD